jgi:hypothetical protein
MHQLRHYEKHHEKHRLHHRVTVLAVVSTAVIFAACADQTEGTRLATEPGDTNPVVSYVTTRSAALMNPKTHRLETVTSVSTPNGVNASIAAGSVTTAGMQVASNAPGIAPAGGRASWSFTDSSKHVHKIVFLYLSGGPPSAMQHYTDGVLVSTTSYTWARTQLGWARTRSYMQSVRNGSLVATYTTTTVPTKSGTGGPIETVRLERAPAVSPMQKTLGSLAYALAFAFAPQDATAQSIYFYSCRLEWLRYAASAALLSGAAIALAAVPELTPAVSTSFISLLLSTATLEDSLIDCMLRFDSLSSGGFISGGSGGGTGGGWPPDKWDCFIGSFLSRCTTNWSL